MINKYSKSSIFTQPILSNCFYKFWFGLKTLSPTALNLQPLKIYSKLFKLEISAK